MGGANAAWSTRSVTMGDGGWRRAPAYDVDHEVFALLDRFNWGQNLVINMIGREVVPGWPGGW